MEKSKIAIIRLRGLNKLNKNIENTMKMLRLYKKYICVVVDSNDSIMGMLTKIKDYATWGEINAETFRLLIEKRGRITGNKTLSESYMKDRLKVGYDDFTKEFFMFKKKLKDVAGLKTYFRLKPPTGGFERNGTKKPYSMGGSLGYRKDRINELIRKML